MKFKIPGKVMLNGAYMVIQGDQGISIPVDRYLNVSVEEYGDPNVIRMDIRNENFVFKYESEVKQWKSEIYHKDSQVFENILNNTIGSVEKGMKIACSYDDGFWVKNGAKTGIGSSACLLVMFCRISSWLRNTNINSISGRRDFVREVQRVNKMVNRGSSGCDVTVCATGPILYSKDAYLEIRVPEKYLILGSFGKSTSTREMISKINVNESWSHLRRINSLIGKGHLLYEEYLDAVYMLSKEIVPEKQYRILKETFAMGVLKCGVSGSGGEDAVWALVGSDKIQKIRSMWKKRFKYVKVCKTVNHGVIDE